MDIVQSDIEMILKSIQNEILEEKELKEKAKKAAESTESSTTSSSKSPMESSAESSPAMAKSILTPGVPLDKGADCGVTPGNGGVVKSQGDVAQAVEDEDLHQMYSGLEPTELKDHLLAAVMASLSHAGHNTQGLWTAYKSASEAEQPIEVDDGQTQQMQALSQHIQTLEKGNDALVKQNQDLVKSVQEQNTKIVDLMGKFETLASKPQAQQAVTAKTSEDQIVLDRSGIVKSLAELAKKDLSESDRDLVTKYTLRPAMTKELSDFIKRVK